MGLFSGLFDAAAAGAESEGDFAEAGAYGTAENYAKQNAAIAQEAGAIKLEQTNRQVFKTLGAQQAEYAGAAGLTGGGSAQEVLRNSVSQGALEKAIVNEQTQINVTGYQEQAAQFAGMQAHADAAGAAAAAKGIGGILSIFGL